MDYKSFFFYPFSLANITVDLNQQRKSWWKLTVIISGSTWPFLPSSPDPVVKISVTANLAVVKERFQACIKSPSIWETSKSLLRNIFSISFFIIHLQPFQCHFFWRIKVVFSCFTFKKKAFNLRNSELTSLKLKHFQRHNGPESWVLLTKETFWVISQVETQIVIKHLQNLDLASTSKSQPNITISTKLKLKNLDQTKPESRPRMNFIATTKHQHLNKTYKYWPNLASESRQRIIFKTSTKYQHFD